MLSQAPSRLHHSRISSFEARDNRPSTRIIVSTKAMSTRDGPNVKAYQSSLTPGATQPGVVHEHQPTKSRRMPQSAAYTAPTEIMVVNPAMPHFTPVRLSIEARLKHNVRVKMTMPGQNHPFRVSKSNCEYVAPLNAGLCACPHRIAASSKAAPSSGTTISHCVKP